MYMLKVIKNSLLETQEQFIPYKVKGRQQNKRAPWLTNELLGVLNSKKTKTKKHASYGKVAKYPSRTTRALIRHAEIQPGKLRLS